MKSSSVLTDTEFGFYYTKDPVKSLDNLGHRINTVTGEP
jgi:hypothetical protein